MNFLLILTILLAPASVYTGKQLIPNEMSTPISPESSASAPIELSTGSVSSDPLSGMEFATIPSGSFMMGSPESEMEDGVTRVLVIPLVFLLLS